LFVNLHGYGSEPPRDPGSVLEHFLRVMGVPPEDIPAELEERGNLYRSHLAGRRMLVVLDNARTMDQIRPLLPGTSASLFVVTSRNRLSPLSAHAGAQRFELGMLDEPEAEALITGVIDGRRSGDDPALIKRLAALCGRLPLALRIVAERAAGRPQTTLAEMIGELLEESSQWDALSIEDGQEADSVRAVFEWSYRYLPPATARAFRLFGQHPGAVFGVGAASALLGESAAEAGKHLDTLTGAHMLEQGASHRYQFHDLMRAYAETQARQAESDEQSRAAIVRVLRWYLRSADAAVRATQSLYPAVSVESDAAVTPEVFGTADAAVQWFHLERANLMAVSRAAAKAGLLDEVCKVAEILYPLYESSSALDDWLETAERGLQAAQQGGDRCREARMLQILGGAC
jgi:hypothetical protein